MSEEATTQLATTAAAGGHVTANLLVLFVVMLFAGLLGGTVNYFLRVPERENGDKGGRIRHFTKNRLLHQCLFMGVAAAFVIPVFLQIASLGVDKNILTNFLMNAGNTANPAELANAYTSLALIGGFCVLAAVSSPTFLQNLSSKILQQANEASATARQAQTEAEAAQQKAQQLEDGREPEIDARIEALRRELMPDAPEDSEDEDAAAANAPNSVEPAPDAPAPDAASSPGKGFELSELDTLIMKALAAKPNTRRSIKGIRTDPVLTNSDKYNKETYSTIRPRMYRLKSAGYVRELTAADGKLPRWKLTAKGWAELK